MLKHKPIIPPDDMPDRCVVCGGHVHTCKYPPVCDSEGCQGEWRFTLEYEKMCREETSKIKDMK